MARVALRKPEVLRATGWSNSTLYKKISEGKFPRPTKIDPAGRVSVWFDDQVAEIQKRAVEHAEPAAA
jgi:predicted DNA-binding transcriptional regulator AlpA